MSNTLVLLGAGDQAKVCYEIAVSMGNWSEFIVLDDDPEKDFFDVAGPIADYKKYKGADFFVAVGTNHLRKEYIGNVLKNQLNLVTLIHPSAVISPNAKISPGTVVMAGAVVSSLTTIGMGCILNTSSTVDHDNVIGSYVHISPGCNTAGGVVIDELTWMGINSTVINRVHIASEIVVGAGSTVINDLINPGVYVGTPAKFKKEMT